MELLIALFVLIGVFVVMTAIALAISYVVGRTLYDREKPKADAGDTDPCAQCHADRDWYQALPSNKQVIVTAWWLYNRLIWASKGCR